jgi:hypothetical protein
VGRMENSMLRAARTVLLTLGVRLMNTVGPAMIYLGT